MGRAIAMDSYDKRTAEEKKKYHGFDKYEAEGFARSLEEAAVILNDPKKMKAASSFVDAKKKSLATLDQMKKSANKMGQEDE